MKFIGHWIIFSKQWTPKTNNLSINLILIFVLEGVHLFLLNFVLRLSRFHTLAETPVLGGIGANSDI